MTKTPSLFVTLVCFCQISLAETVVTNWVASPYLREVGGQVYSLQSVVEPRFNWVNGEPIPNPKHIAGHHASSPWQAFEVEGEEPRTAAGAIVWTVKEERGNSSRGASSYLQSIGGYAVGSGDPTYHIGWIKDLRIFVKNCPPLASGQDASIVAMRTGVSADNLEAWDCGIPHLIPIVSTNYTSDEIAALKQNRESAGQIKTYKFALEQAQGGSGYYQLRVGQLYLAGEGVEKNETEARKWLTLAAANGQPEAAKILTANPQP